jgi:hypothetical protein
MALIEDDRAGDVKLRLSFTAPLARGGALFLVSLHVPFGCSACCSLRFSLPGDFFSALTRMDAKQARR